MADIVQSLFGLTPEAYQQRQAAQADKMALEYAQLSPLQQAQFAIGRGAYQLAGALGGQDPMLQMISNRQAIAREIDPNDLDTYKAGILRLRDANDPVGAMQLMQVLQERLKSTAEIGRLEAAAQASRAQATRERAPPTTSELTNARAIALQAGPEGSPEYNAAFRAEYDRLTAPKETKEPTTQELTNARAIALRAGPVGSPEYNAAFDKEYLRLTTKTPASERFGVEREAESMAQFRKPFAELTQDQQQQVNEAVTRKQTRIATASAPKIIMPGERVGPKDWMQFEKFVGDDPTLKRTNELLAVAPNAIQTISKITSNDVAARALPATLARLVGETGPLSNRDVERYARTGGLDDRLAQAATEFISGRGTNRQKDQAMQFLSAVYRGALLEKKQFYMDQAERLGYDKSPEYTKTIQQIDRELAKFREIKPPVATPAAQPSTTTAPAGKTGNPLIDKYLSPGS